MSSNPGPCVVKIARVLLRPPLIAIFCCAVNVVQGVIFSLRQKTLLVVLLPTNSCCIKVAGDSVLLDKVLIVLYRGRFDICSLKQTASSLTDYTPK
jgi:hypothetical protein